MQKIIPYGKQHITDEDIEAVVNVLKSDFLTQGPEIANFEKAFSSYVGCKYSVAVANGTAALHLCAIALNVQPGDKVIVPPISFSASANCIRYCGGEVVFSDIDPDTLLLDISKLRNKLEISPKNTYKGMVVVDFGGRPAKLNEFKMLADEFGLWIIEDACHAPGAFFTDAEGVKQYAGNGVYAELAIFSFHPVKHIASGEGGMITTNDEVLYQKLLMLRTHGIVKDTALFTNTVEDAGGAGEIYPGWYMEMQELGYNYRLTDFQAALGLSQLKKADAGMKRRQKIAETYNKAFGTNRKIRLCSNETSTDLFRNAYHLYIIQVKDRLGLYNYLREHNIYAQVHYFPIHLMPYYQNFGWKKGDMPFSEMYYSNCLSLPIYPTLSEEAQQYVVNKINSYLV